MSNKNSLRLFIALPLDSEFKKSLNRTRKKISNSKNIKLIPKENLHLTLVFLGKIKEEEIFNIEKSIEKIISQYNEFEIRTSQVSLFKNMIWIEFEKNEDLLRLQKDLKELLKKYKPEKIEFKPHITLAKSQKNITKFASQRIDLSLKARTINLYNSELTPEGAQHTIISTFNFLPKDKQI